MFPEVLRIGDFVIMSFGAIMMLSFLVGRYVLGRQLERYGRASQLAWDLILWIMIGGLVGAKLYFCTGTMITTLFETARLDGVDRSCVEAAPPTRFRLPGDRELTLLP